MHQKNKHASKADFCLKLQISTVSTIGSFSATAGLFCINIPFPCHYMELRKPDENKKKKNAPIVTIRVSVSAAPSTSGVPTAAQLFPGRSLTTSALY